MLIVTKHLILKPPSRKEVWLCFVSSFISLKLQYAQTCFKRIAVVWVQVSIQVFSQRSPGPFAFSPIVLYIMMILSQLNIKNCSNASSSLLVVSEWTSDAVLSLSSFSSDSDEEVQLSSSCSDLLGCGSSWWRIPKKMFWKLSGCFSVIARTLLG